MCRELEQEEFGDPVPAVLVQPVPCQGGTVRGWWLVWVLCHMNRAMRPWLWGPCAGTHGRGGSLGLLLPWGTQEPPLAVPLGCAAMSLP